MEAREIAEILYDLASDMDRDDYLDTKDNELSLMAKEIQDLKDNDCILYYVMYAIAESNAA